MPLRSPSAVLASLPLVILSALLFVAAVPSSGTLIAPSPGQTSTVAWSGGPYTGATADPSLCTSVTCDAFVLTVNVPSTFYATNPDDAVHVKINWTSSTNDFDLYVSDPSGNVLCSSAQGGTTFEDADCGQLSNGTYTVKVAAFATADATYNGAAMLGPEPTTQTSRARYTSGSVYLNSLWLGSATQSSSFDGGLTFPQVVEVTTPALGVRPGLQGNVVVDPRSGTIYNVFVGAQENQLYLLRSIDGGRTFGLKLIFRSPTGISIGNVFPAIAVDAAGYLHVVFSDGHNVYLCSSADGGATWTLPARVNNGAGTKTAIALWIEAGSSGKVNVVWWGTTASSYVDASADWHVFFAQTQNAFANVVAFAETTGAKSSRCCAPTR